VPSSSDAAYKQFHADSAQIKQLAGEIELIVIELIGGQSGTVWDGPTLDPESIARLAKYAPDKTVASVVIIGGDGKEIIKQSGDVNVKSTLETL